MDDSSVILLLSILLALLCSGFFSGMEIAFITANRLKIALDKKQGSLGANIISKFIDKPARFIGTMLVGNNIAIVIYSLMMSKLLEPQIEILVLSKASVLVIQTIISTLLVLVFAEFFPKTVFRINPNRALMLGAIPLIVIYYILLVPTLFTLGLANGVLKLFGYESPDNEEMAFGKVDLDHYLEEQTKISSEDNMEHEVKIFHNALNFSEVIARDCMIPRNEIVAFDVDTELDTLRTKFRETGLSKILIYRDSIDNIIGYVHLFDLFTEPRNLKSVLLPVSIVPETITANKILEELIKKNRSIALVVDEFGGTSGMVTMEDVIEEIFGEIDDEHDLGDISNRQVGENVFEFSGRAEIDLLNEKFKLNIPVSEEYETLAGYIINRTEDIPEQGEVLQVDKFEILIKEVSHTRIDQVMLTIIE